MLFATPDGPNVLWPEGRFDACKLSFIPRLAVFCRRIPIMHGYAPLLMNLAIMQRVRGRGLVLWR
jgi:hypothetical protein